MKNLTILLLICLLNLNANAQIVFNEAIGGAQADEAIFIEKTNDGGYVVVGWTASFGAGSWDLYLIKLNEQGNIVWTKSYGGPSGEVDCSIQQTTDGGYIIASRTESWGAGASDVYLVKTDSLGVVEWTNTCGGIGWDEGHSVLQSPDGGFIHTGYTTSYGAGGNDIYVIKNDNTGALQWTKTFGGTSNDHGHLIKKGADSGYIIAAETNSFGAGGYDFCLLKINQNGDYEWSKTYGGVGNDNGWSVQATSDSGYIFAGYTESFGATGRDCYLIKTNVNGIVQWSKTYGGNGDDIVISVEQTNDGGYILGGETSTFGFGDDDAYLIKTDANGNLQWSKTYGGGGDDECRSVRQADDGGYIIAGYTNSFGPGDWDFFIVKTDASGNSTGCNETNPFSTETTVATITSIASMLIDSGGITGNTPTLESSGGTITVCVPEFIHEHHNAINEIKISPNPAANRVNLLLNKAVSEATLRILTLTGEILLEKTNVRGSTVNLDISHLSIGMYNVEITEEDYIARVRMVKN